MNNFDILFAKKLAGGGSPPPVLIEKNITANGTYTASDDSADGYSSVTVNVPQGGGSSVSKKDVNFYDYDGTVVASYTASEFAELTALPENPTHDGLTSQGWNWTLSEAKTYVASYGKLNVGQMYITSDGKTRLYIRLGDGRLKPYLGLTGDGIGTAVSIDWGDNSTEESVILDTNTVYAPHEYSAAGDYVIAITVTSGSITFTGNDSQKSNILRKTATPQYVLDRVYLYTLSKVELGSSVTLSDSAFQTCISLSSVTIPSSVTSIGNRAFYGCTSLSSVTIPSSVTSIGGSAFQSCSTLSSVTIPNTVTIGDSVFASCISLSSVTIPSSVTSIGNGFFSTCISLSSVTISSSVTSIGGSAFNDCTGLGFIKFKRSTPPTAGMLAFNNIPIDCIIYVPTGSLSAYTSKTNYPSSSTYTYVEY